MPDGRVIEPQPILGIESDGMLCSARELGLGDDHAGILILPREHAARRAVRRGARARDRDVLYDLDVTRNLPGLLGLPRRRPSISPPASASTARRRA